jgi:hypothetical protein
MTLPTRTVTIDGVDLSSDANRVDVMLRENAISNAVITMNDDFSKTFNNAVAQYDTVRIDLKNAESSEREVFGGYVTDLTSGRDINGGRVCRVNVLGLGIALQRMRVAEEYGSQSRNETIDTVREIITDAAVGIVPNYVNDTLDSGTASGYSLQTASGGDNYIEDEATVLRYLYFPYTPANKALQQICDLISADNYASAGVHWQVIPSGGTPYLCVATVNAHATPVTKLWPNDTSIGTLTEGNQIQSQNLSLKPSLANYVVYFGKFQRPTAERATEGATPHTQWTATIGAVSTSATAVVGSDSVLCSTGVGVNMYWPNAGMSLDTSAIGTERSIPSISFYLQRNAAANDAIYVELETGAAGGGNYFYHSCPTAAAATWYHFTFPVGAYYSKADWVSNFAWLENGAPDWTDIDQVRIVDTGGANSSVYIDDFHFDGIVTRGAKCNTAITAQGGKIMLVRDSLAVDDSIVAATDTGTVAQLAKAELIRAKTTPISGVINIAMEESVLPGQIQHLHCNVKSDGTYMIDGDFRVLEVHHTLTVDGAGTRLVVTDDILNGVARSPTSSYNALLRAVSPDFQDRNASSLKARDIDLLQTILETNYA